MLRQRLKRILFGLLGKDPEAVVVTFLSGEAALAARMREEVRGLVPERRHVTVGLEGTDADLVLRPGSTLTLWMQLRRALGRYRVGLAPLLLDGDARFSALRRAAFLFAPGRILAYNRSLERHHLQLRTGLASLLFLRGVPVHRIYARPRWLQPWKRRPAEQAQPRVHSGRAFEPGRQRVLVATPYVPYPLSHGGAVRMYHLLREAAREFDLILFAFTEGGEEELAPLLEFCCAIVLARKREHEEPRWSTLLPPETFEYDSPALRAALAEARREFRPDLVQVEYTALAGHGGDLLVEHDVTFDLQRQIYEREPSVAAWWNWWRWRRFELGALERFRRAVVMSEKDAAMLPGVPTAIIPNGVDLARFRPAPEGPGARLLFIGSFRHFPNIVAYRFFVEEVWPRVRERCSDAELTVVAGPDPLLYWKAATGTLAPPEDPRIKLLGFVRDVRPLYLEANLVIVPTLVSAGTNLKVLEAMAMERAVVSTGCGCAGLGLRHGESVWVAEGAGAFAEGVTHLLEDPGLRRSIAAAARRVAEEQFDWSRLGAAQRALYRELLNPGRKAAPGVRPARPEDVPALDRIQKLAPEAVLWEPHTYLHYECSVAEVDGQVVGFIVVRRAGEVEGEVLSLIVDPAWRRRGIAGVLLNQAMRGSAASWFLEVRESNWPARELYRKLGFQVVSARPKYYQDNGETAVVMRR